MLLECLEKLSEWRSKLGMKILTVFISILLVVIVSEVSDGSPCIYHLKKYGDIQTCDILNDNDWINISKLQSININ